MRYASFFLGKHPLYRAKRLQLKRDSFHGATRLMLTLLPPLRRLGQHSITGAVDGLQRRPPKGLSGGAAREQPGQVP